MTRKVIIDTTYAWFTEGQNQKVIATLSTTANMDMSVRVEKWRGPDGWESNAIVVLDTMMFFSGHRAILLSNLLRQAGEMARAWDSDPNNIPKEAQP